MLSGSINLVPGMANSYHQDWLNEVSLVRYKGNGIWSVRSTLGFKF